MELKPFEELPIVVRMNVVSEVVQVMKGAKGAKDVNSEFPFCDECYSIIMKKFNLKDANDVFNHIVSWEQWRLIVSEIAENYRFMVMGFDDHDEEEFLSRRYGYYLISECLDK